MRTPFGLKDGRILAPDDVESGLACGCACPGCGAPLVAKKGPEKVWHFAHHNVLAGLSCVESAIHAAAKQVLLDENWLRVPEMWIAVSRQTKSGIPHTLRKGLASKRTIRFDSSRAEVWETNLRPDVVGYRGDRRILIEMFFTHQVDEAKRLKLRAMGLPVIEIDLSHVEVDTGFNGVRQRVLHDVENKEWLFYPGELEAKAELTTTLNNAVIQIDLDYEKHLAEGKRKDETQLRRSQARDEERARDAERLRRGHERYQAVPLAEKECRLRESLGISGVWPHYLNRPSVQASAIPQPVRVWQAGIFAAFIFRKGGSRPRIQLEPLLAWAVVRFGVADDHVSDARAAIKLFLGYLRGCGFLEKSSYSPYEPDYYTVVHDALTLPVRTRKIENESKIERHVNSQIPVDGLRPIVKPHWHWTDEWPSRADVLKTARALLSASPYINTLLPLAASLSPRGRPNEPVVAAVLLEASGTPRLVTLNFLVELGLAFERSRTI